MMANICVIGVIEWHKVPCLKSIMFPMLMLTPVSLCALPAGSCNPSMSDCSNSMQSLGLPSCYF